MTGALRWHSCSTNDFPLKRHKVSKACEPCRGKKMRCDGKNPCQRCELNNIRCIYKDRPARSRTSISTTTAASAPVITTVEKKQQQQQKATLSSPTTTRSSSCSLSPQPQPQKRQELNVPVPTNITNSNLNKITFLNELYETLRLQQSPNTRRYGTSIPPLFMDFFNTTSQPQTIWTYFIVCFNRFCDSQPIPDNAYFMRDAPELESNELVKETCRVFVTHNLLYGSFIDTNLLLFVLESVSMFSYMQTTSTPTSATFASAPYATKTVDESSLPCYSILTYSILAITFQSAYQSLPNMNEKFTNSLYIYSHVFYREAHKRFLAICFPTIPAADPPPVAGASSKKKKKDQQQRILLLVQASILLTHFQCTAINEEQAFMTIKIGLSLAQQLSVSLSIDPLLKSLDAWYVWLAFYMKKPYSIDELDYMLNFPNTLEELVSDQQQQEEYALNRADNTSSREQRWALHVTEAHTCFLKSLLLFKKTKSQSISMNSIKESLKLLNHLIIFDDNEEQDYQEFIPSNIISLYHDILTIQLYTCQLDQGLSNLISDEAAEQNIVFSTQNILTTVNKVIFVEYNNTNATAPLKYVPLSIIYSMCLVSQINIYLQRKDLKLLNMLKIASPYFEAFQILYSKFSQLSPSSPPASLSTSSSTTSTSMVTAAAVAVTTADVSSLLPADFLSPNNGNNDLLLDQQQNLLPMATTATAGIIVRSRADIDREQLEKLSHNKHHTYQSQLQHHQQQQLLLQKQLNHHNQQQQQFQFNQPPLNNYYLQQQQQQSSSRRGLQQLNQLGAGNEQYLYYSNGSSSGQKRSHHHHQQQQQQLYNQFNGYHMQQQQQQHVTKRHRSNTTASSSYDEFTSANNKVILPQQQEERAPKSAANGFMDLVEPSTQDAFLWMLEGAAATTTGTNSNDFYNNNNSEKQQQKYAHSQQLPLPQPTTMTSKNWSSAALSSQDCTKLFFDSEVQTLHYQTPPLIHFESMSGLLSASSGGNGTEDTSSTSHPNSSNLVYQHNRASISSSVGTSSQHSTVTNEMNEAAAAAAAEAIWQSTAAAVQQASCGTTATTNSGRKSQNKSLFQQQQGASHWINTEKVGGDEDDYWPE